MDDAFWELIRKLNPPIEIPKKTYVRKKLNGSLFSQIFLIPLQIIRCWSLPILLKPVILPALDPLTIESGKWLNL